jgi:hypothetical protein
MRVSLISSLVMTPTPSSNSICLAAFALGLLVFVGCEPPPRPEFSHISKPDQTTQNTTVPHLEEVVDAGDAIAFKQLRLPWETWHTYFIGGQRIGFMHVRSEMDTEGDGENIRTTIEDQLTLRRGSSTLVQSLKQSSIETADGALVRFDADLRVGPLRTRFEGQANNDSLNVTTIRGTTRTAEKLPWSPRYYGIAAVQQSLLAKPIQLNESRRIQLLIPLHNRQGTVDLKCNNRASISTMDGKVHDALEVDVKTIVADGSPLESTIWVDNSGLLLKSYTPSLDLMAILSPKDYSLKAAANPSDLFSLTSISVAGTLSNPDQAYRVGFLLKPKPLADNSKAELAVEPQPGQWFRRTDDGAIQLLVSRDANEPDRDGFVASKLVPEPGDSQSGPIIDSAAAGVRKLAALSKATDPKEVALDLTATVKQLIGKGDFSRGFATASQTARDNVGDCTERAVLLAAMMRAREIPARVAAGLVYVGSGKKPVMAYHMWTLAWINDRWVAFDPTTSGLAPADRIVLASSHLGDGNEYACLASVMSAIGRMEVQIVNAKYQSIE